MHPQAYACTHSLSCIHTTNERARARAHTHTHTTLYVRAQELLQIAVGLLDTERAVEEEVGGAGSEGD